MYTYASIQFAMISTCKQKLSLKFKDLEETKDYKFIQFDCQWFEPLLMNNEDKDEIFIKHDI